MNICKDLRERLGLSLSAMQRESGVAVSTIKAFEYGGVVQPWAVAKIADYFGVTIDELCGRQPLDIVAWSNGNQKNFGQPIEAPVEFKKPTSYFELGIKHIIKVAQTAVNHYLDEGWILLDTLASEEEATFYCLLGNTKRYTQEDFDTMRSKSADKAKSTSYWMPPMR